MPVHEIAIVRGSTRIDTLIHRARVADRERPWDVEHTLELELFWPLETVDHEALCDAWCALASVTDWGAATLANVLTVLRGSVPSPERDLELPALGREV